MLLQKYTRNYIFDKWVCSKISTIGTCYVFILLFLSYQVNAQSCPTCGTNMVNTGTFGSYPNSGNTGSGTYLYEPNGISPVWVARQSTTGISTGPFNFTSNGGNTRFITYNDVDGGVNLAGGVVSGTGANATHPTEDKLQLVNLIPMSFTAGSAYVFCIDQATVFNNYTMYFQWVLVDGNGNTVQVLGSYRTRNAVSTNTTAPSDKDTWTQLATTSSLSTGALTTYSNTVTMATSGTYYVALKWYGGNAINPGGGDDVAFDNVSIKPPCVNISGNVFNDLNGVTDNTISGTGTNAGGLNAVLVDASGNVVAVVPVAADGTYSFTNVPGGAGLSIRITTNTATVGSPAPLVVLPTGWATTGENLGTGTGSDGTANGILPLGTVNTSITNANFAIEKPPTSTSVSQIIAQPSGNTIPAGTITSNVSGSDPEDGTYTSGSGHTIVITALPTNGTMVYNGQPVTAGQSIANFDPALLSFTNLQNGTTSTSFTYAFLDAAGVQGTSATFSVNWSGPLPIVFGKIDAYFNGEYLTVNWSTVKEINTDYFDIEISSDGYNFAKIGQVKSTASSGNSSTPLDYEFKIKNNDVLPLLGGVGFIALAFSLISKRKRNLLKFAAVLLFSIPLLFIPSCKKANYLSENNLTKAFIRIIEVDQSGNKSSSKIVQVYNN